MTLETAKRIVSEQGENASKEAKAVVRGGMTICELAADGRRTYPWVKVLPTKTDGESSIELALKMRRPTGKSKSKEEQLKQKPATAPVKVPEALPAQVIKEESTDENRSLSIYSLISKAKQKLRELWLELDEIVVE